MNKTAEEILNGQWFFKKKEFECYDSYHIEYENFVNKCKNNRREFKNVEGDCQKKVLDYVNNCLKEAREILGVE